MTDKRFAKDVARELDRRQRKRRLGFLVAWAALIAFAIAYVRCGKGWGLGGKGEGSGGSGVEFGTLPTDAAPDRCTIRVTGAGIFVDGKAMKRDDAVTLCSKRHGADVVVTGDARQGTWEDLEQALRAAKVEIYVHSATP